MVFFANSPPAAAADAVNPPFANRQRVPPFPRESTWLNTAGPLELKDLQGKFVLLDFWTYCCINCMHILPELKKLERAYPNHLAVIGVHSAKFATERDSNNIAEAIRRYKIEHPVINDAQHVLWNRFGVNSWPTVILIDPEGYAVWGTSGEITAEQVDKVLKAALPYYRRNKLLDETPLRFDFERRKAAATPLEFPGKILADEKGGRLFIADGNHNRIVVARLDGTLLFVIGSGAAGLSDGDFAAAEFNQPQGMALDGATLYIADTENHAIRKADLSARKVATIAGVGRQSRAPPPASRRADPRKTALNSPWDLLLEGSDLFIAMAGSHQIWKMNLDGSAIGPYSGNGREDIVNGPLLPRQSYQLGYASFAQPSGLASDGTWLYVADSEGSSIRAVPLDPRRQVRTVVGTSHLMDARLFTFGDADGPAPQAQFQHPLGVAFYEGQLYVADTYNNKIRIVDPQTGAVGTLSGTGKPGRDDAPASFDEPAGISAAAGKLYVADTNNHLVRVVELATKKVSTLPISGLAPPQPAAEKSRSLAGAVEEKVGSALVRAENGAVRLSIEIELPQGFKIDPQAPMAYRLEEAPPRFKAAADNSKTEAKLVGRANFGKSRPVEKPAQSLEINLPLNAAEGRDAFRLILDYYYCREGAEGLCKAGTVFWTIPLEISPTADRAGVSLRHRVP
ncbi:MAG: redoxin domain-containing protein [Pirellulales bacterium]|nr:redoxin domain-containing protein [Pirellulales bacterium]